jgi:hypothetical protein
VNYELVDMTNDMLVLEASLPAGGGEVLLLEELVYETVSPCNAHELRVHVSCPPSEGVCVWGNYRVRIVHEDHCPQPIPCPPPTGCVP